MHPLENLSKLSEPNQGFENVAIACPDDDSCTYKIRISRDIEFPDPYHRRTDCNFTVNRFLDHPAAQVNMTSQLCKGEFDGFKVSSQWYYRGFLTFCVVHEASDSWAFFFWLPSPAYPQLHRAAYVCQRLFSDWNLQ